MDRGGRREWVRGPTAPTTGKNPQASASVDRARLSNGDEGYMPRYDLAAVCALRDEREEAWRWLGEAISVGWWFPDLARRDPLLRSLREYAPFESLLNQPPGVPRPR